MTRGGACHFDPRLEAAASSSLFLFDCESGIRRFASPIIAVVFTIIKIIYRAIAGRSLYLVR